MFGRVARGCIEDRSKVLDAADLRGKSSLKSPEQCLPLCGTLSPESARNLIKMRSFRCYKRKQAFTLSLQIKKMLTLQLSYNVGSVVIYSRVI